MGQKLAAIGELNSFWLKNEHKYKYIEYCNVSHVIPLLSKPGQIEKDFVRGTCIPLCGHLF